jgi:hypothetical protein
VDRCLLSLKYTLDSMWSELFMVGISTLDIL